MGVEIFGARTLGDLRFGEAALEEISNASVADASVMEACHKDRGYRAIRPLRIDAALTSGFHMRPRNADRWRPTP